MRSFLLYSKGGTMDEIETDLTWLTDERIRDIKQGDEGTRAELLSLAGEVRARRRAMTAETWRDKPALL